MTHAIICDTNVWYDLPDKVQPALDTPLVGTLINLAELTRSNRLPEQIDVVRRACAQMLMRHREIRIDPPMIYVARVSDIATDFDSDSNARDFLGFVEGLASGDELNPGRLDEFRNALARERQRALEAAEGLNKLVEQVRAAGVNKRDPNRGRDLDSTKRLIASMVSNSIKKEVEVRQINWDEIQLFLQVTHALFLEMEISKRKFKPNDIGDHYNLIYVGKEEQYWTSEQRWIRVVHASGMAHHLFPGQ